MKNEILGLLKAGSSGNAIIETFRVTRMAVKGAEREAPTRQRIRGGRLQSHLEQCGYHRYHQEES